LVATQQELSRSWSNFFDGFRNLLPESASINVCKVFATADRIFAPTAPQDRRDLRCCMRFCTTNVLTHGNGTHCSSPFQHIANFESRAALLRFPWPVLHARGAAGVHSGSEFLSKRNIGD